MENSILLKDLFTVVIGLFISIITAYLTVQFSINKFRTERWWEEKVKVYNQILESLAHIKRLNHVLYNAEEIGLGISKNYSDELRKKASISLNEIKRIEATGALIINKKVTNRLTQFLKNYEMLYLDDKSYMAYLGDRINEIESCIEIIINFAKEDLRIK